MADLRAQIEALWRQRDEIDLEDLDAPGRDPRGGETGEEVSRGVVRPWCLVLNATRPKELPGGTFGFPCALIIRRFAEGERHDKAKLNAVLREASPEAGRKIEVDRSVFDELRVAWR